MEIRSGRFLSRDIDTITLRTGRSGSVSMRIVLFCDANGNPAQEICRVEFPSDVPHLQSMAKLEAVMGLLDAGVQAKTAAAGAKH